MHQRGESGRREREELERDDRGEGNGARGNQYGSRSRRAEEQWRGEEREGRKSRGRRRKKCRREGEGDVRNTE